MTFNQWMLQLDRAVSAKIGASVHDLPDMTFRDWFDDGLTIEEAVEEVLDAQGLNEFSEDISDFNGEGDEDFDDLDDEHDEILAQQELEDFEGLTFRDEEVAMDGWD